ncbi:MAG: hypothetical protein E6Q77_05975 [Rhizobium sp.]|nr:MAG: hypothetical protein E6Q77_05975 [Rhizobium sp.]
MDISHNHHRSNLPVVIAALLAGAGMFGLVQSGYLKEALHKEILARIDPATVLTVAETNPQKRRATTPAAERPLAVSVR